MEEPDTAALEANRENHDFLQGELFQHLKLQSQVLTLRKTVNENYCPTHVFESDPSTDILEIPTAPPSYSVTPQPIPNPSSVSLAQPSVSQPVQLPAQFPASPSRALADSPAHDILSSPVLYPPLDSLSLSDDSPISHRLRPDPPQIVPMRRQMKQGTLEATNLAMPLRQVPVANPPDAAGHPRPPTISLVYQPFTTTDLYNWKSHCPPYSERPQATIDLITSIIRTHRPTWSDCQELLLCLLNTEERKRVLQESLTKAQADADAADPNWINNHFPSQDPNWDPNDATHNTFLMRYRQYILEGLRLASRKPTNISKVSEVLQKSNESSAAFYERLCDAYRTFTPFNPEKPENLRMVNTSFVSQTQPDIRRKLQKQDGFAGMNTVQLLEIAQRVFMNRDSANRQ
uniref:Uncharacterized protein LOC117359174 n=1 Tax=Geotrypetes seraphini TaxID=260995 RepID=A0A6P8QE62_GEOSA|nr:uncharacterized protein LOC117359174 [Geotrypetes seraphini]